MKPYCGMVVIYRGRSPSSTYNGHDDQPGVVTTTFGGSACANVKVLPDHGPPFDAGSVPFYESKEAADAAFDAPQLSSSVCYPANAAERAA